MSSTTSHNSKLNPWIDYCICNVEMKSLNRLQYMYVIMKLAIEFFENCQNVILGNYQWNSMLLFRRVETMHGGMLFSNSALGSPFSTVNCRNAFNAAFQTSSLSSWFCITSHCIVEILDDYWRAQLGGDQDPKSSARITHTFMISIETRASLFMIFQTPFLETKGGKRSIECMFADKSIKMSLQWEVLIRRELIYLFYMQYELEEKESEPLQKSLLVGIWDCFW